MRSKIVKIYSFFVVLFTPVLVFAQTLVAPGSVRWENLNEAVEALVGYALLIAGVILVVMLIVGGIQYLTAGGNEEQSAKAKKLLLDAIVGILIVAAAWAIATFVISRLFRGVSGPKLPT